MPDSANVKRQIMFSLFKPNNAPQTDNRLFRLTIHVTRGTNSEMPTNLTGAYVPVFVGANDHESAAIAAVKSLSKRGFEFVGIADDKIHELDPEKWDQFVREAWPEFVEDFPRQNEVVEGLKGQFLYTGPFASYEASNAA